MNGFEFLLGTAASLLASAVENSFQRQLNDWERRRVDRQIQGLTDAVLEPLLNYLQQEGIHEHDARTIAREAEKLVRFLLDDPNYMIRMGLNPERIATKLLEEKLDQSGKAISRQFPAAFDLVLRALVDLAVRVPPLFSNWERQQFAATYDRLYDLERSLSRIYGDMRRVVESHERGERIIDQIIAYQAGRLAIKLNMHGLRHAELPQTRIENLFVQPNFELIRYIGSTISEAQDFVNEHLIKYLRMRSGMRCVIIAPAGAGKTTWINWYSAHLLQEAKHSSLPIVVSLRHATQASSLSYFYDLVGSSVSPAFREKLNPKVIEEWVLSGKLHLLLDGFDEVSELERDRAWGWIDDISAANPNLNVIITSRPLTTNHIDDFLRV